MSFAWTVSPEEALVPLVDAYAEAIEREIVALADGMTDEITSYMKTEARWTDRTGEARANLYSDVIHVARQSVTIIVRHGPTIHYGIYLETVSGGRFGIIADTVDWFGPLLFYRVREIVQKVRAG